MNTKTRSGQPTPIKRLSSVDEFVPDFGPNSESEPTIRVLGPVEFNVAGQPALRKFPGGTKRINTNGVSMLLRVDYGRTRVLLTGDLNKASQQALLEDYTGRDGVTLRCCEGVSSWQR